MANKENHKTKQGPTPGLIALLQQMHEPQQKEELTDGGVAVSAMKGALSALPPPHKLVGGTGKSAAHAMEDALEAEWHANRYIPRAPRQSVDTRLNRLEQRYLNELKPKNQVQRVTKMLQAHREKLQAKFSEWDVDGNGEITREELARVMRGLGFEVRPAEIDDFFDEFDPDDSGALDLKEFYNVAYSGGLRRLSGANPTNL